MRQCGILYIINYNLNLKDSQVNLKTFYANEYSQYALYDSIRSIGSYIDGQKITARKTLYTVGQKNITQPVKVIRLQSTVSEYTSYIHGENSIGGVIINLAQNFAGANNIALLKPEGSFGTRTIPAAAATRYIFSCKHPIYDSIFYDSDLDILEHQTFENEPIEPKFLVPIIPLLLVNGSEGMGTGFAQKILPRNPLDIIKSIEKYLKTKKVTVGSPWFNGYTGTVKWNEDQQNWWVFGKFEKTSVTTIKITEIPIGYTVESYCNVLDKLEDAKVIQSYTDASNKNKFEFTIKATKDFVSNSDEILFDKLKLIKRFSENFTSISENNSVVEFTSAEEIFEAYCKIRLVYYEKRKASIIRKIEDELSLLSNRYLFIKAVTEDKIIINKRTKADVETQCAKLDLRKRNDSYDYLLDLNIISLTEEKMKQQKDKVIKLKAELDKIKSTEPADMWIEELQILKLKLDK